MDEASAKARVALWSVQKTVGLMHATIISRYHQVKMEVTSKPAELERLDRKILQHLNCNLGPLSLVVFLVFLSLVKCCWNRYMWGWKWSAWVWVKTRRGFWNSLKAFRKHHSHPLMSAAGTHIEHHWTGQPVIGKDGWHQWRIGQARLCCNTQLYSDLHWGAMCSSAAFVVELWSWLARKLALEFSRLRSQQGEQEEKWQKERDLLQLSSTFEPDLVTYALVLTASHSLSLSQDH